MVTKKEFSQQWSRLHVLCFCCAGWLSWQFYCFLMILGPHTGGPHEKSKKLHRSKNDEKLEEMKPQLKSGRLGGETDGPGWQLTIGTKIFLLSLRKKNTATKVLFKVWKIVSYNLDVSLLMWVSLMAMGFIS